MVSHVHLLETYSFSVKGLVNIIWLHLELMSLQVNQYSYQLQTIQET